MRRFICFAAAGIIILGSCTRPQVHVRLISQVDTVSYYLGLFYAKNLKSNPDFTKVNPEAVAMAFDQVFSKDSIKVTDAEIQTKLNAYFRNLQKIGGERNLKEGQDFLKKNMKNPGVVVLPSGLQYIVEKQGNGPKPDTTDVVSVQYIGTFIDGKEFDSTVKRGAPAKFPVIGVVKGFTEALLKMNVGSKWKIFIPSELGYGARGPQRIKPNSVLIFEVELLGIEPKTNKAPALPPARKK